MTDADIHQRSINVIRGLAMDGPRAANSGHPGTAMALAPLAYTLWTRVLRYDAAAPEWPDRDRLVLSAGHASILLYAMVHLTGHDLSLDDLRAFRQLGSRTPGHPEVRHTPAVEVTTGPLGQGLANAVGMAMAEEHLRARLGSDLVDHRTFVIAGDGDLMEGISHEAASFAGHQRLGRLVVVYDDNHITIDGPTELTVTDDASARFRSYGWQVLDAGEIGDDVDALETVLLEAVADPTRPTLIRLRTHIGVPSPAFTDTSAAHGSPFPAEEIARTKQLLGLPVDESWWIGDDVRDHLHEAGRRRRSEREAWEARRAARPDTDLLDAVDAATGLEGWRTALPTWSPGDKVATRNSSKACLAALLDVVPGLMTGGADLTDNTGVSADCGVFRPEDRAGRLVHWGVREHAMAAAMNGLALHGGVLPLGGTFFVFSDYLRPALRLAALSQAKVVFSFTHDSVGVGEDGPTHQPVEHLMALRAMPGLRVMRPADANENAWCWRTAIEHDGPTVLVLSRQNLPVLEGTADNPGVGDGAYVLAELGPAPTDGAGPDLVLIGTGSEVALCLDAARLLAAEGRRVRVVSMPCWELFAAQPEATQASVLGVGVPRLSVEAGVTFGWSRWAHDAVGIDRFGLSAPGDEAMAHLGLTPENVAGRARALLGS